MLSCIITYIDGVVVVWEINIFVKKVPTWMKYIYISKGHVLNIIHFPVLIEIDTCICFIIDNCSQGIYTSIIWFSNPGSRRLLFNLISTWWIFFFEMVYFRSHWSHLDIPTTICSHQMAAVGFEAMALGFLRLSPYSLRHWCWHLHLTKKLCNRLMIVT